MRKAIRNLIRKYNKEEKKKFEPIIKNGFTINIKCQNFEYSKTFEIPSDVDTIDIEFKNITLNLPIQTGPEEFI